MGENGQKEKRIIVDLNGEQVTDFYAVKEFLGIGTNVDVFRHLLRKEVRRIRASEVVVRPENDGGYHRPWMLRSAIVSSRAGGAGGAGMTTMGPFVVLRTRRQHLAERLQAPESVEAGEIVREVAALDAYLYQLHGRLPADCAHLATRARVALGQLQRSLEERGVS